MDYELLFLLSVPIFLVCLYSSLICGYVSHPYIILVHGPIHRFPMIYNSPRCSCSCGSRTLHSVPFYYCLAIRISCDWGLARASMCASMHAWTHGCLEINGEKLVLLLLRIHCGAADSFFLFCPGGKKKATKSLQPACRDYTIHLHKVVHGIQFKKRAPRAIREIKKFAEKVMHTKVG